MPAAARHTAFDFRGRDHPGDGYTSQLRIRTDEQVPPWDRDAALRAALASPRQFGELTVDAESPR
jgi:hypothetical protein